MKKWEADAQRAKELWGRLNRAFEERMNEIGTNRRTNPQNARRAPDQPNSGSRGAEAQGAGQGADQGAREGARIKALQEHFAEVQKFRDLLIQAGIVPPRTARFRKKWAPPLMDGDLGQPNAAKFWTPHGIGHMQSEGIVAGEIIAWRAWYWDEKRHRLRSLFVDYEWPIEGQPAVGEPGRGYGIHAFKSKPRTVAEYIMNECLDEVIVGEVALWGDVIEFEDGYTAEFARVHSLPNDVPAEVRKLYLP